MCSSDPPAPDPNVGLAAQQNAEVAREVLAFNKQVYEEGKPRQAEYAKLVDEIVNQQMELGAKSAELSQDYTDYMKSTFRPIEQALAGEAAEAGGAGDQEKLAGEAGVDVATSFEAGRGAQLRDMGRVGTNPNSGAYLSADTSSRVMEAATRAKAMNDARTQAKNLGWAKKMDVANVGRNLPSSQATSAGIALNAGNAATANAAAPTTMANQNAAQMNAGYGASVNANTAAGGLYANQYNSQLAGWGAQQQADASTWQGVGQLGTSAAMLYMMSSKKLKHNKEKVSAEIILKGLKKLPDIESWKYKKGVADEGRHIGPYAEDVRAAFGEEAAPGGKTIDVISMIGINMAAIKGLSKQVDRIERKVKSKATAEICRHGI